MLKFLSILVAGLLIVPHIMAANCPGHFKIQEIGDRIEAQIEFSNSITEIANEAQNLNRISAYLAIGSGTLFISSSLALYYLSLNPGIIGSVVTLARLPTGAAGAVIGLSLAETLKLSSVSLLLKNTVVVTISLAAGHLESVYFIGQGLYQISIANTKKTFTDQDIQHSLQNIDLSLELVTSEINNLLNNPPSKIRNSVTFGGSNAQHFQRMADLTQFRVLLLEEQRRQLLLQERVCRL